ncbi:ABC transporter permease [Sesbania bispinosa]|nr:ABC transporter permease [Sesbania bispinosa]
MTMNGSLNKVDMNVFQENGASWRKLATCYWKLLSGEKSILSLYSIILASLEKSCLFCFPSSSRAENMECWFSGTRRMQLEDKWITSRQQL